MVLMFLNGFKNFLVTHAKYMKFKFQFPYTGCVGKRPPMLVCTVWGMLLHYDSRTEQFAMVTCGPRNLKYLLSGPLQEKKLSTLALKDGISKKQFHLSK